MKQFRQYLQPIIILIVFETVAVSLWLTKNNLFYLFNFSYIGLSISLGIFLFIRICRLRGSGTIFCQAFLKRRRSIMLLPKYSVP